MKKLIIVAIVVIGVLLTPALIAIVTKSEVENAVAQIEETPGYDVELLDYRQGYLSSNAKVLVDFDMGATQFPSTGNELDSLGVLGNGVILNVDINHGPVILKPGFAFALNHITVNLDEDQDFVQEALQELGVDYLAEVRATLGFSGNGTGAFSVPEFSFSDTDGSLNFGGLNIDFEKSGKSYSLHGEMKTVVFSSPMLNLDMAPATIIGSSEIAEELSLSPGTFEIKFPKITYNGMDSGEFENLVLKAKSTLSDDNMVNAYITYSVDKAQSAMAGMNVTDAVLDLGFENLNGDVILEISEMSQDLNQLEQDPNMMMDKFAGLLNDSPKIVIKQLGFTLNGVRNLDATGELGINSDMLSQPVTLDTPMLLIGAIDSQLSATIHQSLVAQITQMVAARQSQAAMQYMDLTPEQVGEMIQEQTLQTQMMLEQFTQQGFIKKEGDNYILDAKFQQGGLTLNGNPMPLM